MAARFCVAAGNWNSTAIWATSSGGTPGASVPGASDTVTFDGNSGDVTLDVNADCASLDVAPACTGDFDAVTFSITVADGGDVTLAGAGIFDAGTNANHSVTNCTFDYKAQATFTFGLGSLCTFNGTCIGIGQANYFCSMTIPAGDLFTIPVGERWDVSGRNVNIDGDIVINGSRLLCYDGRVDFGTAGEVSGPGTFWILYPTSSGWGLVTFPAGAVISTGEFRYLVRGNNALPTGGAYNSALNYFYGFNTLGAIRVEAGSITFPGDVEIGSNGNQIFSWDNTTYGPTTITFEGYLRLWTAETGPLWIINSGQTVNWIIEGDVITDIAGGPLLWIAGNGAITASEGNAQDWDWMGETVEDVVINKTAGTVLTLLSNFECADITLTSGNLDLADYQVTSEDVVCDGTVSILFNHPATWLCNSWTIDLGATVFAEGDVDDAELTISPTTAVHVYGTFSTSDVVSSRTIVDVWHGTLHVHTTGELAGYSFSTDGTNTDDNGAYITNEGTVTLDSFVIFRPTNAPDITLGTMTVSDAVVVYTSYIGSRSCNFHDGIILTGDLRIRAIDTGTITVTQETGTAISVAGEYEVWGDAGTVTNSLIVAVGGDITLVYNGVGTIDMSGSQTTLTGTGAQSITTAGGTWGKLIIDSTDTVTPVDDLECGDVTLTSGNLDLADYQVTSEDVVCDGTVNISFNAPGAWLCDSWTINLAATVFVAGDADDAALTISPTTAVHVYGTFRTSTVISSKTVVNVYASTFHIHTTGELDGYGFATARTNNTDNGSYFTNEGTVALNELTIDEPVNAADITLGTMTINSGVLVTGDTGVWSCNFHDGVILAGDLRVQTITNGTLTISQEPDTTINVAVKYAMQVSTGTIINSLIVVVAGDARLLYVGAGTIDMSNSLTTLVGAGAQGITTTASGTWGAIHIDSAGTVTPADGLRCEELLCITGTLDLAHKDLTTTGVTTAGRFNVSAGFQFVGSGMSASVVHIAGTMAVSGQAGNLLDWDAGDWWFLNVDGGAATASYVYARYSDASGGLTINAADGTSDLDLTDINWAGITLLKQGGREGVGVVQRLTGSDYPLVANTPPSSDIRFLIADMWMAYDDPADYDSQLTPFKPPFHIYYMYGFGNLAGSPPLGISPAVNDREMIIVDDTGRVVIETAALEADHPTLYYREDWGDRLEIVGWEKESAVLFVVVHTAWPTPPYTLTPPVSYEQHITPTHAILDERTWQRRPKRLRSVQVLLDNITGVQLELAEGYNTRLTVGDEIVEGSRVKHRVTLNAAPGGGIGIFPGCQPEILWIRRINDISPTTAGDYYMTATDCYWARREIDTQIVGQDRIGVPTPALLQLGNDCGPCCACSQFEATANYMNRTRDRYHVVGVDAEQARNQYHDNRNRWNTGKCCFDQHLLRLQLQSQICPHLDVLGQLCNWTPDCIGPLRMIFDFRATPAVVIDAQQLSIPAALIVPRFTIQYGNLRMTGRRSPHTAAGVVEGVWPLYHYTFFEIEPYQNVWVKFRLFLENCGLDDSNDPFTISCCLRATIDGVPLNVPCGAEVIQPTSSLSDSSWLSVGSNWRGFEICKEETLLCPPDTDDMYNSTTCFSRSQIFAQIGR